MTEDGTVEPDPQPTTEEEPPEPTGEEPPELPAGLLAPAEPAPATPGSRGELRLALAMRGGVSLAVWIGGAIAELDLARRGMRGDTVWPAGAEAERARAAAYAELLRSLGYTDLVVDVLAGASAGGLNAVVYGFAQSVGTDLEWLKEVWEKQGDLWNLFHDQWDADQPYRTEAVLDADGSFYPTVLGQLRKRAGWGRPELETDYLTVDLAATLQSGPPLPDRRTDADLRPRTAHFRFRRTPAALGPFNDVPPPGLDAERSPVTDEALRRLAYAARSTSSFPGAFEPAGVFSYPAGADEPDGRPDARPDDGGPRNLAAVFSEIGTTATSTFDVMDGGVFDNIPIGRAVQAISDAPAASETRRILVYLDPSPPHPGPALSAPRAVRGGRRLMRARFLRSALTALRYKQTVESSGDDLREINRLREVVDDVQTRRGLFLEALPGVLAQDVGASPLSMRYREFRVKADADRLCQLLTAPGTGFLRALVPSPAVASAIGVDDIDLVKKRIEARLRERVAYPCETDATALVAATDLYISWLRRQQAANAGPPAELGQAKMAVYRVRTFALYLRQRLERDAVLAAIGPDAAPPERPRWIVDDASVAAALWPVVDAPAESPEVALDTEGGLWSALTLAETVAGDLRGWAQPGWQALCDAVNRLPDCAARRLIVAGSQSESRPDAALRPAHPQLLVMAASVAVGSLGTTAVPDFFTFSGDEPPIAAGPEVPGPEDPELSVVAEQGRAQALDAALARRRTTSSAGLLGPVNARSKLAGNQLANFAGFLDKDWRTHDWQWGRADAGAALVRMLGELHPAEAAEPMREAAGLVRALYPGLNRRKLTLADLPGPRRYALGARLGLGLQRALWPLTPKSRATEGFRLRDVPAMVALMVLRPMLVLVPLLLRVPVLTGVVAMVAVGHHWTREQAPTPRALGPGSFTVAAAAALVLLGTQMASLLLSRRRWKRQTTAPATDFRRDVMRLQTRRTAVAAGLALVVVVLVLARLTDWAALGWLREAVTRTTGFDAVALLGALVAGNLVAGRTGAGSVVLARHGRPARDVAGWLAGAVLVVVGAGLPWLAATLDDGATPGRLVGARVATAVVVGGVVWAVHHAWTDAWLAGALAALSALATSWLLWRPTWFGFGEGGQLFGWSAASGDWETVYDLATLGLVIGLIYLAGLASRWLTGRLGAGGPVLGLLVMMLAALWSAWQLTLAWSSLGTLPTGLVLGGAIAAATTLVVPFRERLD